jgi:hypothetical protein
MSKRRYISEALEKQINIIQAQELRKPHIRECSFAQASEIAAQIVEREIMKQETLPVMHG